jgi:histidyl-tRNA synthetase
VQVAERLRGGSIGLRVAVDLEECGIKDQLAYSDKLGAPFIVLVGLEDIRGDQCKLRDRVNGTEATVAASALEEELTRRIEKGRR